MAYAFRIGGSRRLIHGSTWAARNLLIPAREMNHGPHYAVRTRRGIGMLGWRLVTVSERTEETASCFRLHKCMRHRRRQPCVGPAALGEWQNRHLLHICVPWRQRKVRGTLAGAPGHAPHNTKTTLSLAAAAFGPHTHTHVLTSFQITPLTFRRTLSTTARKLSTLSKKAAQGAIVSTAVGTHMSLTLFGGVGSSFTRRNRHCCGISHGM